MLGCGSEPTLEEQPTQQDTKMGQGFPTSPGHTVLADIDIDIDLTVSVVLIHDTVRRAG